MWPTVKGTGPKTGPSPADSSSSRPTDGAAPSRSGSSLAVKHSLKQGAARPAAQQVVAAPYQAAVSGLKLDVAISGAGLFRSGQAASGLAREITDFAAGCLDRGRELTADEYSSAMNELARFEAAARTLNGAGDEGRRDLKQLVAASAVALFMLTALNTLDPAASTESCAAVGNAIRCLASADGRKNITAAAEALSTLLPPDAQLPALNDLVDLKLSAVSEAASLEAALPLEVTVADVLNGTAVLEAALEKCGQALSRTGSSPLAGHFCEPQSRALSLFENRAQALKDEADHDVRQRFDLALAAVNAAGNHEELNEALRTGLQQMKDLPGWLQPPEGYGEALHSAAVVKNACLQISTTLPDDFHLSQAGISLSTAEELACATMDLLGDKLSEEGRLALNEALGDLDSAISERRAAASAPVREHLAGLTESLAEIADQAAILTADGRLPLAGEVADLNGRLEALKLEIDEALSDGAVDAGNHKLWSDRFGEEDRALWQGSLRSLAARVEGAKLAATLEGALTGLREAASGGRTYGVIEAVISRMPDAESQRRELLLTRLGEFSTENFTALKGRLDALLNQPPGSVMSAPRTAQSMRLIARDAERLLSAEDRARFRENFSAAEAALKESCAKRALGGDEFKALVKAMDGQMVPRQGLELLLKAGWSSPALIARLTDQTFSGLTPAAMTDLLKTIGRGLAEEAGSSGRQAAMEAVDSLLGPEHSLDNAALAAKLALAPPEEREAVTVAHQADRNRRALFDRLKENSLGRVALKNAAIDSHDGLSESFLRKLVLGHDEHYDDLDIYLLNCYWDRYKERHGGNDTEELRTRFIARAEIGGRRGLDAANFHSYLSLGGGCAQVARKAGRVSRGLTFFNRRMDRKINQAADRDGSWNIDRMISVMRNRIAASAPPRIDLAASAPGSGEARNLDVARRDNPGWQGDAESRAVLIKQGALVDGHLFAGRVRGRDTAAMTLALTSLLAPRREGAFTAEDAARLAGEFKNLKIQRHLRLDSLEGGSLGSGLSSDAGGREYRTLLREMKARSVKLAASPGLQSAVDEFNETAQKLLTFMEDNGLMNKSRLILGAAALPDGTGGQADLQRLAAKCGVSQTAAADLGRTYGRERGRICEEVRQVSQEMSLVRREAASRVTPRTSEDLRILNNMIGLAILQSFRDAGGPRDGLTLERWLTGLPLTSDALRARPEFEAIAAKMTAKGIEPELARTCVESTLMNPSRLQLVDGLRSLGRYHGGSRRDIKMRHAAFRQWHNQTPGQRKAALSATIKRGLGQLEGGDALTVNRRLSLNFTTDPVAVIKSIPGGPAGVVLAGNLALSNGMSLVKLPNGGVKACLDAKAAASLTGVLAGLGKIGMVNLTAAGNVSSGLSLTFANADDCAEFMGAVLARIEVTPALLAKCRDVESFHQGGGGLIAGAGITYTQPLTGDLGEGAVASLASMLEPTISASGTVALTGFRRSAVNLQADTKTVVAGATFTASVSAGVQLNRDPGITIRAKSSKRPPDATVGPQAGFERGRVDGGRGRFSAGAEVDLRQMEAEVSASYSAGHTQLTRTTADGLRLKGVSRNLTAVFTKDGDGNVNRAKVDDFCRRAGLSNETADRIVRQIDQSDSDELTLTLTRELAPDVVEKANAVRPGQKFELPVILDSGDFRPARLELKPASGGGNSLTDALIGTAGLTFSFNAAETVFVTRSGGRAVEIFLD
ncbi:hypothetical protein C4J81_17740 [Deltaproteobacteria bacterium Smac51]|nr:hypothetical protein C4J81_17740 [Deltaproteobacteria bacterium Smac51]